MRTKGRLNIKNNAMDKTINFCSWRFFMKLLKENTNINKNQHY